MNDKRTWFVKRGKETKGPFPEGLLTRYILLGRLRGTDLVSHDRQEWHAIKDVPGLVPEVMREAETHPEDPAAREHLELARRWADERRGGHDSLPEGERRSSESDTAIHHREARGQLLARERNRSQWVAYAAILLIVAAVAAIPFLLPGSDLDGEVNCEAAPAPGVNWSNCRLEGRDFANADLAGSHLTNGRFAGALLRAANLSAADLAYADLTRVNLRAARLEGARLVGTDLSGADLTAASLKGADLSYADLGGSQLEGANLEGARLDHAIWPDGSTCLPGSVGECLVPAGG